MKILVTFAVAQEFAPWRALRNFRRHDVLGVPVQVTRVGDVETHVVLTGIGASHALRSARAAFANGYQACISTGLAGALKHIHPPGRVLVARTVRTGIGDDFLYTDGRLRRLAAVSGARVVDAFYSAERILIHAREKAALNLLADAVEMESYSILDEARRWSVPAVALRVISDGAAEDLPLDFNQTISRAGGVSLPLLLKQIAHQPRVVKSLIRFGRESRRAAMRLAAFLDSYVEALAGVTEDAGSLAHKVTG